MRYCLLLERTSLNKIGSKKDTIITSRTSIIYITSLICIGKGLKLRIFGMSKKESIIGGVHEII
jgi:hypothetical protein